MRLKKHSIGVLKMRIEITQGDLKKHLNYNPNTGIFTWIKRRKKANSIKIGAIAGTINNTGYISIGAGKESKKILAHRLAFLYVDGVMPEYVDHINHIRTDNKWNNLRASSYSINSKNRLLQKTNTSGASGVYFYKKINKWCVEIGFNNKSIYLGSYKNKETAVTIRKAAEGWYGYHKNHGEIL